MFADDDDDEKVAKKENYSEIVFRGTYKRWLALRNIRFRLEN